MTSLGLSSTAIPSAHMEAPSPTSLEGCWVGQEGGQENRQRKASPVPAARHSTLRGFPYTCWPIHQPFACLTQQLAAGWLEWVWAGGFRRWQADEGGGGVRLDKVYCHLPLGKKDRKPEIPPKGSSDPWIPVGRGSNHSLRSKRTDFRIQVKASRGQELKCPFLHTEKHQSVKLLIWGKAFRGTMMAL